MKSICLVDIESAYCAIERVFRPDLGDAGVLVLSNNDGAAVAVNPTAKALGIKNGAPYFKLKEQIKQHNIHVFSSNYALYNSFSNRMMMAIESIVPTYTQYSIDEAFCDTSGIEDVEPLVEFGHRLKQRIWDWTRLPVRVGLGPSKTLAKVASYGAKHYPKTGGVVDLTDRERQVRLLRLMDVGEVWGIGSRLRKQLNAMDVHTALDLANQNPKDMRRYFSVNMERTVRELNGEQCFPFDDSSAEKQQIVVSRSFGERVTTRDEMTGAITEYTAMAAKKLRSQGSIARHFTLFIRTSPFASDPQYSKTVATSLPWPTDDTRAFLARAKMMLDSIWRPGYRYAKAGVMLGDISPLKNNQEDLFRGSERPAGDPLMGLVDKMNDRGLDIRFAAQTGRTGKMKQARLSPRYTTRFSDVPIAKVR